MKKPSSLVLDLQSVREPAQAYVMFSRVQALNQLFILGALYPDKIKACPKALAELERMNKTAVNMSKNKMTFIVSCNIRCMQKNIEDLKLTSCFNNARVVCLQETWLVSGLSSLNVMKMIDWQQWNICAGRGKGITTFYKNEFQQKGHVIGENFQMARVVSEELDIINVYRSSNANTNNFVESLRSLFNETKKTYIVGDFNLCFDSERTHPVFMFLENSKFKQLVQNATHIKGRLIDLVFTNSPEEVIRVSQNGQYFSDHDMIIVF